MTNYKRSLWIQVVDTVFSIALFIMGILAFIHLLNVKETNEIIRSGFVAAICLWLSKIYDNTGSKDE